MGKRNRDEKSKNKDEKDKEYVPLQKGWKEWRQGGKKWEREQKYGEGKWEDNKKLIPAPRIIPTYNKYGVAGGRKEGEGKYSQSEKGEDKEYKKDEEDREERKYGWPTREREGGVCKAT